MGPAYANAILNYTLTDSSGGTLLEDGTWSGVLLVSWYGLLHLTAVNTRCESSSTSRVKQPSRARTSILGVASFATTCAQLIH